MPPNHAHLLSSLKTAALFTRGFCTAGPHCIHTFKPQFQTQKQTHIIQNTTQDPTYNPEPFQQTWPNKFTGCCHLAFVALEAHVLCSPFRPRLQAASYTTRVCAKTALGATANPSLVIAVAAKAQLPGVAEGVKLFDVNVAAPLLAVRTPATT